MRIDLGDVVGEKGHAMDTGSCRVNSRTSTRDGGLCTGDGAVFGIAMQPQTNTSITSIDEIKMRYLIN